LDPPHAPVPLDLPLKAVALNLLSVAASYGMLVLVFRFGALTPFDLLVMGLTTAAAGDHVRARLIRMVRLLCRPLGYLALVCALTALSAAARFFGEEHELGYFCGRLSGAIWRYPEITRRGVRMAWVIWAVLFAVAASPIDPLATWWDAVVLAGLAAAVLWRRLFDGRRAGR
jgi:hypothetical protein